MLFRMDILQGFYPFYRWTCESFPVWGYNKKAVNEHWCTSKYLGKYLFAFLLNKYIGVEELCYGRICSRKSQTLLFSKESNLSCMRLPVPPYLWEHLIWSVFLNCSHSNGCAVLSYIINLHFLNDMMVSIFSYGYLPSLSLLWSVCSNFDQYF